MSLQPNLLIIRIYASVTTAIPSTGKVSLYHKEHYTSYIPQTESMSDTIIRYSNEVKLIHPEFQLIITLDLLLKSLILSWHEYTYMFEKLILMLELLTFILLCCKVGSLRI